MNIKKPVIPTTERLAEALEELGDPRLDEMIKRARQGFYDDYKSPYPFPLLKLKLELQSAGYTWMVNRVIAGEFDATYEEAREWFEKEGRHLILGEGGKEQ